MHYLTDVLKKYAVFSGRARRKEYWMFMLANIVVGVVIGLLGAATAGPDGAPSTIATIVLWVYSIAILLPSLAVTVRRLHDTDRSGWWILISLIPLIGAIVLIIFYVTDGTKGPNRFGADPKAPTVAPAMGNVQ